MANFMGTLPMPKYEKPLCKQCNLDNDCYCQNKSQNSVNQCGMEHVFSYNQRLNEAHKKGRNIERGFYD